MATAGWKHTSDNPWRFKVPAEDLRWSIDEGENIILTESEEHLRWALDEFMEDYEDIRLVGFDGLTERISEVKHLNWHRQNTGHSSLRFLGKGVDYLRSEPIVEVQLEIIQAQIEHLNQSFKVHEVSIFSLIIEENLKASELVKL